MRFETIAACFALCRRSGRILGGLDHSWNQLFLQTLVLLLIYTRRLSVRTAAVSPYPFRAMSFMLLVQQLVNPFPESYFLVVTAGLR